jgi:hypothetical protein
MLPAKLRRSTIGDKHEPKSPSLEIGLDGLPRLGSFPLRVVSKEEADDLASDLSVGTRLDLDQCRVAFLVDSRMVK